MKQAGADGRYILASVSGRDVTEKNTGYMICGGYRQRTCKKCRAIT